MPPDTFGKWRHQEFIEDIEYAWLATPRYKENGTKRFLNILCFIGQLFLYAENIIRKFKPDVVIASSTYPLDIFPAHYIAKRCNAKLVFEIHDLWPFSPMELGKMSKWHPFIMIMQFAENYYCRHADVVISILPLVHEHLLSKGFPLSRLHIIPNGVSVEEWSNEGREPLDAKIARQLSEIKADGYRIVGYAGTHGLANALEWLLEGAKLIRDEKVMFVFVGDGPSKVNLQKQARDEGARNVLFFEPVRKRQIPALLSFFDVACITLKKQPLFRFGISPNKIMDYMMAGLPILNAIEAGNDPVAEADCGITVEPENPQAIADGIRKLLAKGDTELRRMGQRGRQFIIENQDYKDLAKKFLMAID